MNEIEIERQILEVFNRYTRMEEKSKGRKGLTLNVIAQLTPSCSESELLNGITRLLNKKELKQNNIKDSLGRDLYVLPKWGVNPPNFR